MASIGLYGVTAYNAGRRVSEIGVRMALGANRGDVVRLVLRGAFGLILFGLLIGLPLTFAAGRFLGNQLYGMNPYNPVVILAAVGALGLSAMVASFVPAFRASSISPRYCSAVTCDHGEKTIKILPARQPLTVNGRRLGAIICQGVAGGTRW